MKSSAAKSSIARYQHPLVAVLRRYAATFGDFEQPLLRAARQVDLIASIDDATMYAKVIAAIGVGCNHFPDLVDETKLAETEVKRIWEELIIGGVYEERPIAIDGGRGRRTKGIFLTSEPSGNLPPGVVTDRRLDQYHNADEDDGEDEE